MSGSTNPLLVPSKASATHRVRRVKKIPATAVVRGPTRLSMVYVHHGPCADCDVEGMPVQLWLRDAIRVFFSVSSSVLYLHGEPSSP